MENTAFDLNNVQVQLTIVIKLQQLQKSSIPALSYENLEDYIKEVLWKKKYPRSLHTAANDILSITAADIVRFLSRQTILNSSKEKLSDFSDLIGGKSTNE